MIWLYGDMFFVDDFEWRLMTEASVIAGPVLAISLINRPKPPTISDAFSRSNLFLPRYVSVARYLSGAAFVLGFIVTLALETGISLGVGAAFCVALNEWASRRFYREDEVSWAIAYYNKKDGFFGAENDD